MIEHGPAGWLVHSSRYRLATCGDTLEEALTNMEHLEATMARLTATRIKEHVSINQQPEPEEETGACSSLN